MDARRARSIPAFLAGALAAASCAAHDTDVGLGPLARRDLDHAFRAEGVAVADLDGDGVLDVATDQLWWDGATWSAHAIREPETWDPRTSYSRANALYAHDLDGDGDADLLVVPFPGTPMHWLENQGAGARFVAHPMLPDPSTETPQWADLFRDGRPVLVAGRLSDETVGFAEPGASPLEPWAFHAISPSRDALGVPEGGGFGARFAHGLGVGDVDGDGRPDVLVDRGVFLQPVGARARAEAGDDAAWPFVPTAFCPRGCATMLVLDVDGDGVADVVTASPHQYGVWWFRGLGGARFEPARTIDGSISETHALALADLDGDGAPEIVTGKRWYSHGEGEPGWHEPVLLVAYRPERRRDDGGARDVRFRRVVLDEGAGVGTQVVARDVDGDGRDDVVVASKRGVFVLAGRR